MTLTPPDSPNTPAEEGTQTPNPDIYALEYTTRDGKYTVQQTHMGALVALRYGQEWRNCVGDNLVLALAQEAADLRAQLTSTQQALAEAQKQARLEWERHAEKDRAYGDMIKQRDDAVDAKNAMLEQLEKHTDGFMRANFRVTSLERQIAGIEWTDAAKKLLYENDALKAQLATLRQQNEALRRDAQRFEWLTVQLEDVSFDGCDPTEHMTEMMNWPEAWRRAIDSTCAAQQAEGKP